MKSYVTTTLFIIILVVPFQTILAQNGGHAGSFSRMGFSPRGMAMGNAMSSVYQEGSYSYYNPALSAAPMKHTLFDLSTAALKFDRNLHMVTTHFQLPPSAGFSLYLMNARVGGIDGRTSSGYHTEMLSTNEFQLSGNFGLRFSEKIWGGVGVSYNLANFHSDVPNTTTIGIQVGILFKPTKNISISGVVKDLLASYDFDTSDLYNTERRTDTVFSFPTRIIGGVSAQITKNLLLSSDIELRLHSFQTKQLVFDNDEFGAVEQTITNNSTSSSTYVRTGLRHHLHERLTLRGGIQLNEVGKENILQPSAGFSIHLPYDRFSPTIDYAFMREPSQLSTMHVFAIRLHI